MRNSETAFLRIASSQQEYLNQWYLETPAIITSNRYNRLHYIQQLLYRAIHHFVAHYDEYEHIFPISDNIRRVVDICAPFPYRVGTYRPDLLIDKNRQLKICEIGARFPLNGYFLSGIAEYIGQRSYRYNSYLNQPEYERFLHYLMEYWNGLDKLYVLKGSDRPCDIKYYIPFFEELGVEVEALSPESLHHSSLRKLAGCFTLNEFNQMEMDALGDDVLRAIAASNTLNDMRTIFLIHDKRFLAVLSDTGFLSQFLDKDEISCLQPYLIPTYTSLQAPELWEDARQNKEKWVLKHALLGKSEQVYTGRTCTPEEWEQLFTLPVQSAMVLQSFIQQQQVYSSIKGVQYHDYVVGTMLCFDNNFFGPGLFRTSSFEITNRVDDRKMAPCFTDDYSGYTTNFIL